MRKGEIIRGAKTKHPIIFIKRENQDSFIGCMLTHGTDKKFKGNTLFSKEHFRDRDDNGNVYDLTYSKSFFVDQRLIKEDEWGPFVKVGELTYEGIKYLEKNISHKKPISWKHYLSTK